MRLRDGRKTLATARLGKPGKAWRRRPFALRPKADAADASLEIAVPTMNNSCLRSFSTNRIHWPGESL